MYPSCLNGFIGLTKEPSPCLQGSDVSNTSTVGLFVDQDPSFNACRFADGDTRCQLIETMISFREEAYQTVATDVGAILLGHMKAKPEAYYYIGQNEFGPYYATHLVPTNPSIEIHTDNRPGGKIRIDKIALMIQPFDTTAGVTVQVRVYKKNKTTLVWSQVHAWLMDIRQISTQPRPVDSYTIDTDGSVYRVEYTYDPATFRVPDTDYHCGCGDQLKSARGFILENPSKSYGISIYATLYCDSGQALCNLLADDIYKMVIGNLIRQKIIFLLLDKIYHDQNINRWSLLSGEDLANRIQAYSDSYNSRLLWIDEQKSLPVDGFCFTCGGGSMQQMKKYNMLTGVSR